MAAAVLLWWNEGRAVTTARSLGEGAGAVVAIDPARPDPARQGQLVHLTGPLNAAGPAVDAETGIGAAGQGVVLRRRVQIYQWREQSNRNTQERLGGGQTTTTFYRYERVWSDQPIDSANFQSPGHANPPPRLREARWVATNPTVGAIGLPPEALNGLGGARPVPLTPADAAQFGQRTGLHAQLNGGEIYVGFSPAAPAIGDLRVTWEAVPRQPVTAVGQLLGSALGPYQTRAGDRILVLREGTLAADALFAREQQSNHALTWILRGVGVLLMFAGFALVAAPLAVLGAVLPILSQIAAFGALLGAFVLTAVLAPAVVALAWFAARPLLSLGVLVAGAALAAAGAWLGRRRRAAPAAPGRVPGPG
nr:TMEM43 family protein [Roseomonas acroporae]